MEKLTILLLFSAIMVTLVVLALISQIIVPEEEGSFLIQKNKSSKTNAIQTLPLDKNDCDSAAVDLDCAIVSYLEENAVFTSIGGRNFCSYETLGSREDEIYLDILCEEFYLKDGKIYEGSGTAGPAKITKTGDEISNIWRPRDGSFYTLDMQANFPADLQGMNPNTEKLSQINRQRAKNYFKADFDYKAEKTIDIACDYDFECVTPDEYLVMSRCPFTSMCLEGNCTVVCPNLYNLK